VDPKAGLDDVEKRKFLTYWDSNSDPLVVKPVALPTPTFFSKDKKR
jgi:hypothetical protein